MLYANNESWNTTSNKLRASEGRRVEEWDRLALGSKEGTYCMVHWVLFATNESWNFTSKTGDVMYGEKPCIVW